MNCCVRFTLVVIFLQLGNPLFAEAKVDYLQEIKPLFKEHCFSCHGVLKQSGELRLDTAAAMVRGGASGSAIVPGKADESFLVDVLTGDAGFQMPPEGDGHPLSAEERDLIIRWINEGAIAPENEQPQADPATYWSYQPLKKVAIPKESRGEGSHNPIDVFVDAKRKEQGLTPQSLAPPEVLLRRVYLDLVGYPPTREQLARFTADPSDKAYEAVVDELLASPQYGERWGRHWMDVWRYSDWYGRRPSNEIRYGQRHIWRWRDWIINSLNADKGYDQMLVEMLAGDEIAPTDVDVLAATGFLGRNWYKFDKNAWLFETVEQTGRGFLAATLQCCRCHDHKYDPFTQKEYYEYRAFFEPHGFRTDPIGTNRKTEIDDGKDEVLADGLSRAFDESPDKPTYLFLRGDDRNPDKSQPLVPQVPMSLGREGLLIQPIKLPAESYLPQLSQQAQELAYEDGSKAIDQAQKKRDETGKELNSLNNQLAQLEKSDVESQMTPFLQEDFSTLDLNRWKVVSGQWAVRDGKLLQSQVTSFATLVSAQDHPRNFVAKVRYRKLKPGTYRSVGWSFDYQNSGRDSQDVYTARSDSQPAGSVQAFHRQNGKQIYPPEAIKPAEIQVNDWIDLEFEVRETQLTIKLNGELKLEYRLPLERNPGKFAIWVHQGSVEIDSLEVSPVIPSADDLKSAIAAAEHQLRIADLSIDLAEAKATFQQSQIVAERFRLGVDQGDASAAARKAHREELQILLIAAQIEAANAQRQQSLAGTEANQQKTQNANTKLEQAQTNFENADGAYTQFQPKFPQESTGRRLALARWLTRPDHPRTARVAVNHIWLRHFGEALVPSVDNFGLSGKTPSHPLLLDWLANQLVEGGWKMKPLHKLIVLSQTYRLSSAKGRNSLNHERDPQNKFLWRANARRMEAEVVRDSLLAISGELDVTMGGPDIDENQGQTMKRRSLYFRTTPDNQMQMLSLFDQANPDECYRRRESVIPQQALALMNGPLAIDLSRILAGKIRDAINEEENPQFESRFIELAFETILSRAPKPEEVTVCLAFLDESSTLLRDRKKLTAFPKAAVQVTIPASSDPKQRARESLIHTLFNHNEFLTIR
ncbi:DUF1553 domain-containing protein [Thalassoroseus pseudoceratinae]|uniref:DUF1553 domain-containing protein n=1 Tax=Thalassoroseus pseudoceratinae TaxID=2713176 RepID=UPI00141FDF6B|nr:DUF1553 domain-containing protein [Thalassoroseus pseudoceratinae]